MAERSGASQGGRTRRRSARARARGAVGARLVAGGIALVVLSGCASTAPPDALAVVRDARDAAAASAHAASLERAAVFLRDKWGPVALPEVTVERWVAAEEWGPTMARCLDDAGFTGTRPADDGERLDYSAVQLGSTREFFEIDVAGWICQARYPVRAWFDDEVRAIEAPWAFTYVTATLVPCLLASGYPVPALPDPDEFTAAWRSDVAFDAYALIGESAAERARAAARCPSPETVLDGTP